MVSHKRIIHDGFYCIYTNASTSTNSAKRQGIHDPSPQSLRIESCHVILGLILTRIRKNLGITRRIQTTRSIDLCTACIIEHKYAWGKQQIKTTYLAGFHKYTGYTAVVLFDECPTRHVNCYWHARYGQYVMTGAFSLNLRFHTISVVLNMGINEGSSYPSIYRIQKLQVVLI